MSHRRYERHELQQKATWDLYTGGVGGKPGYITNISQGGCLLKTNENIDHQRWIRMLIHNEMNNLTFTVVGKIARRENVIEVFGEDDATLYRYGVQFMRPEALSLQDFDLILAFSSKNFTQRSCRIRNIKSSFLPGSLA